ncbi:28S ribosomal protein S22, mitochondrial [Leguminivora glycinivorella]|uniref:28S ribosomal protein S22, mitochondrial n=1 Tax=Leguminivora glycinivorella TaxID=1035111 RepID=UPI00200D9DA9|nr:28S ribosomal protein S22, mitochondrial [Leguminivora glycinivorella]
MSILFKKFAQSSVKNVILKNSDVQFLIYSRKLSFVPSLYDGDKDPAPKFFSPDIQVLLKRLTRPDLAKVFRKRTNSGLPVLRTPKYKFLTSEELEQEVAKANERADQLLQMPPVVKIQQHIQDVLSQDPALIGYDTSKYIFTDISFGVANEHRIIVERLPDGTLQSCDHDIRKRLNQIYFPINGRSIREPLMFTDEDKFNSVLDREQYEFILDRACIQYEPDEPSYQRVTSLTYQHVDAKSRYELLRSTRHFGPLVFYLTWHRSIDSLMLELLQTGAVREAALLIATRQAIHGDIADGHVATKLVQQILPTPIQLTKPDRLTEEDIQLDSSCVDCVQKYITSNSLMKSQQELALQGFREHYQQLVKLSRGIKVAHGTA